MSKYELIEMLEESDEEDVFINSGFGTVDFTVKKQDDCIILKPKGTRR